MQRAFANSASRYNPAMGRRRIGQIVVLLQLALFLLAPVYESFDLWNGFRRSGGGNDKTLSLIAAVTFCGVVLVAGRSHLTALTQKGPIKLETWLEPWIAPLATSS
ncbi:MAG: hypothetical protein M3R43_07575 [Acidobacteriota bacterium]|nr:hypothetical protein [Acidobacteriota bacterium]